MTMLSDGRGVLVLEGQDEIALKAMEGATIGGSITFPSGKKISEPPAGHEWHIANGKLEQRQKVQNE